MSEQNKSLIRTLLRAVACNGDYGVAEELVSSDYVGHSSDPQAETHGIEGYKQFFRLLRTAFPDLRIEVNDQIAEGDRVVTRWTAYATHEGEFFGIPPSGKKGEMSGINIERVVGGKVVECWSQGRAEAAGYTTVG
jgi:steroid delta-isomerase-like uncharacterized protein